MGQPACVEEFDVHFRMQLDVMLRDMKSARIHHNDLGKKGPMTGAIEVLRQNGRISLVDFGLASLNGSHTISCDINGTRYAARDHVYAIAKQGLHKSEDSDSVLSTMQNCSNRTR